MPENPLVSIIMNCYNGEKFLKEAINSVLTQTYENWELIFWDNQSVDQSKDVFKSFSDNRLKYFYAPKHTLLYEARNFAFKEVSGEFVAFLDVDDWWIPEKLEKQIPLFSDANVGLVCGNFLVVNEIKGNTKISWEGQKPTGWILNELLEDYFVGLLTIILRRKVFDSLEYPFNPHYHIIGDFDLTIRIAENWKIGCVQESISFFRFHGNNESVLQNQLYLTEMESWLYKMKKHDIISNLNGFKIIGETCKYLKGELLLNQNYTWEAIKIFFELSLGLAKLKLLFVLILPRSFLKRLKTL
jgi:glycosyltransferase involved in cell wall biosynthesis